MNFMTGSANDLVELRQMNGDTIPVTTSLKVASYFEKEHKHVMRDIREVLEKSSMMFGQSNFGPSSWVNEQGKKQPMCLLTKDGFTMLAMGYTGEKTMRFKEAYINALNEMERQLTQKVQQGSQPGFLRSFWHSIRNVFAVSDFETQAIPSSSVCDEKNPTNGEEFGKQISDENASVDCPKKTTKSEVGIQNNKTTFFDNEKYAAFLHELDKVAEEAYGLSDFCSKCIYC